MNKAGSPRLSEPQRVRWEGVSVCKGKRISVPERCGSESRGPPPKPFPRACFRFSAMGQFKIENPSHQGQITSVQTIFKGPVYVVRDNIDTDQIIPAQYLNLVPTIPEEYEKLGSFAMAGLPDSLYPARFIKPGQLDSEYSIVVAGRNFGCGSSREHAPIALGSAGCKIVLAEGFARIFFRNAVATGELYPCESLDRLCDILKNGDVVTVDLDKATVTAASTGKAYAFKPLGDVRPVVDAGGLFQYARQTGMIST